MSLGHKRIIKIQMSMSPNKGSFSFEKLCTDIFHISSQKHTLWILLSGTKLYSLIQAFAIYRYTVS